MRLAEKSVFLAVEEHYCPLYRSVFTDGLNDSPQPRLWQRLFLADGRKRNKDGENGGSRAELLKLLTELSQLVESTLIVDRKTGLSFDHKLRKV